MDQYANWRQHICGASRSSRHYGNLPAHYGSKCASLSRLRISRPINSANTIFAKSPIRNGTTHCAIAATNEHFINTINHTVPNKYKTAVPAAMPSKSHIILYDDFTIKIPEINASNMYPTKYPPVGPTSFATPPVYPEKTGSPAKPSIK